MANFISDAAKVVFPNRFKQSLETNQFPTDELGRQIPGPPDRLQLLEIDIVKSRTINFKNDITENPVEDGSVISDNIIERPVEIIIDGLISQASLSNSILNNILSFENPLKSNSDRIQDAYNVLDELRKERTATIIETPQGAVFRDMFIKDLSINDLPKTGEALSFNVTFRHINFVTSQLVIVSNTTISLDTAKATTNYGQQAGEVTPLSELTFSGFIKSGFNFLKGGG